MGARAWAQGSDVYFGKGGFDPKVAAHELVHTVQQGAVQGPQLIEDNDVPDAVNNNHYEDNFLDKAMLADIKKKGKKRKKKK